MHKWFCRRLAKTVLWVRHHLPRANDPSAERSIDGGIHPDLRPLQRAVCRMKHSSIRTNTGSEWPGPTEGGPAAPDLKKPAGAFDHPLRQNVD